VLNKEPMQSRTSQEKNLTDLLRSLKDGPNEIKTTVITPVLASEYENSVKGILDMDK